MFVQVFKLFLLTIFSAAVSSANADELYRPLPGGKAPREKKLEKTEETPQFQDNSSVVPDRWRAFYQGNWYDPYNTNLFKGDLPIFGSQKNPWFLEIGLISTSGLEYQDLPLPVGGASTKSSNQLNTIGDGDILGFAQSLQLLLSLSQGNTTFKPPHFEFRFSPVLNFNIAESPQTGVLNINPSRSTTRFDDHIGIEELFIDYHLMDISARYDFVSVRGGIQPFNADFRGFVYLSNEPGLRFFGNAENNRWQFNLAYFRRLEKDTNSGLNLIQDDRREDVIVANFYRQDTFALGHTLQAVVLHREDRAKDDGRYNTNGFLIRPASIGDERSKNIRSTYLGLNGDGHIGRWNFIESIYFVFGSESHNPIAGREVDILAGQAALEVSYDMDWLRPRLSFFYATGDSDPFDSTATGFDAVVESPQFAGGDNSYWYRQFIPFIGGGGVGLTNKKSFLPNLRAGKEEGQSNFVNPGIQLINVGCDAELTPKLKLISNFNFMMFDETAALEALRQIGSLSRIIGYDLSSSLLYRPFLNNNIRMRVGGALFVPGEGFAELFGDDLRFQTFGELVLQY